MEELGSEDIPISVHGFDANSCHFATSATVHRHNEVELVYARGGDVTLIFDGRPVLLAEGGSAVFWAVVPHFARQCREGAELCWVHVPLRQFLDWRIAPDFTQRILRGQLIRDPSPRPPAVFLAQLDKWRDFSRRGPGESRRIVDLEVEALFREAALRVVGGDAAAAHGRDAGDVDAVEAMVSFIARHYQEPITVADVAASAGLKPGYAMRRFRAAVGTTIVGYINEHRVGQAQRMLVTTDATVLDILLEAGFGSVTQFYSLFERSCGCTPTKYREQSLGAAFRG
ncbi:MAG: helix-turn-helix domain-containing protein [Capsulimonadaceae bacterium]|nr:helix-turn-helix domain-containing protein [Capsulimonadaceae bacterium]